MGAAEPSSAAGTEPRYASIDDLFGHNLFDALVEDVDLPGGLRVRVRALSRFELTNNAKGTDESRVIEARNIACCLLQPQMTYEQVERWQRLSTPNVIGKLVDVIRRLSGLTDDAPKSDVQADGGDRP